MKSGFSFVNLCLATVLTFQVATETGQAATNVAAWGGNGAFQINVPINVTNAVAVAAGSDHSLALRTTGAVAGWGDNTNGETAAPSNLTNAAAIAAGDRFSLALESNGVVVAWGIQTTVPAKATNVVAIAASVSNALALTEGGNVISWVAGPTPPANATNIVVIAAGNNHSLALTGDGRVMAWGDNSLGQTAVPAGLTNVVALAGGKYHSMALMGNGTVFAWGDNTWNQTNMPAGLSNVVAIAAGGFHSLALKQDGTVAVWGDNTFNQTNIPPGLHNVVGIAAGLYHNLAVVGNGSPAITVQPVSQYNPVTGDATFWVMAAGQVPLSYQWQQDGTNIAGANQRAAGVDEPSNVRGRRFLGDGEQCLGNRHQHQRGIAARLAPALLCAPTARPKRPLRQFRIVPSGGPWHRAVKLSMAVRGHEPAGRHESSVEFAKRRGRQCGHIHRHRDQSQRFGDQSNGGLDGDGPAAADHQSVDR